MGVSRTFSNRLVPAAFLLLVASASLAFAHSDQSASARIEISPSGTLQANLKTKAEPFFHGLESESLTWERYRGLGSLPESERKQWLSDLRRLLLQSVEFRVGETWVSPVVGLSPAAGEWLHVRYTAPVAPGSRAITVLNGRTLGKLAVLVSLGGVKSGDEVFLDPGQESAPYSLIEAAPPPSRFKVALQYLALGFQHIVPKGLDHILFVLGLFLLTTRVKPLLLQVTAFTVAHSVTLALSMYQVVSLPPSVVEPLIALSIVYVAVENTCTTKLKPWRAAVVFVFGLLHGLGFAGVLSELGLPRERFVTALVTFNVGVELAQLTVVLAALALAWRIRMKEWYRKRVVIPASVLIALIGLYWSVERIFF